MLYTCQAVKFYCYPVRGCMYNQETHRREYMCAVFITCHIGEYNIHIRL